MFYKYWKQLSLALTGFFWASCNSTTTTEPPLYGAPPEYSSSSESPSSSETVASSSSEAAESSSSEVKVPSSSSEGNISSSSEPLPMPAYGVQMYCEVVSEQDSTITCENGNTCTKKETLRLNPDYEGHPCLTPDPEKEKKGIIQVCPDYGVIYYNDITYECSDGFTYDEYSFKKHYKE